MKLTGIKSVDIKIEAIGHGIVNWNGTASLLIDGVQQRADNHLLPKLRGVDIHRINRARDVDNNARLYISSNCLRNAIFKDFSYGLQAVTLENVPDVLSSILGLIRGYIIAQDKTSLKRKSSLYMTDFLADESCKLNYEQFSQAGARNNTSIFSKHTTGDVSYVGYASINIEDLQFLPLEDTLGRSCFREVLEEKDGLILADKISHYLRELDIEGNRNPQAIFYRNYVRKNSICKEGEAGLLLNDDAIDILVKETIELIKNLSIVRTSGYVKVSNIVVDYNNGNPFRLKNDIDSIHSEKDREYCVYYEPKDMSEQQYKEKIVKQKEAKKEKGKKDKNKNNDKNNSSNIIISNDSNLAVE